MLSVIQQANSLAFQAISLLEIFSVILRRQAGTELGQAQLKPELERPLYFFEDLLHKMD